MFKHEVTKQVSLLLHMDTYGTLEWLLLHSVRPTRSRLQTINAVQNNHFYKQDHHYLSHVSYTLQRYSYVETKTEG